MTKEEVYANLVQHGCCDAGFVWCKDRTSAEVWATTDPGIATGLFWWAVQNMGKPGWKTEAEVRAALADIRTVALSLIGRMYDIAAQTKPIDPVMFLAFLHKEVVWENPTNETEFFARILPIVKRLRPTI